MKSFPNSRAICVINRCGLMVTALCCLPLHAAPKAAPAAIEHKDYTLFMGADFQILKGKKTYPVVDVIGDSFVINVDGERVLARIDRGELKLRVDERLKMTADEVPVHDLVTDRAYTPARDPRKRFLSESMAMSDVQDTQLATVNANAAARQLESVQTGTGSAYKMNANQQSAALASAQAANTRMQSTLQHAQSQAMDMQYSSGAFAGQMQDELARELFDAMDVEFNVSSPKPLSRPYVIVVANYRNPDDRPDQIHNWIFAKQLNPIGSHERREHFLQGGMTPGFTLLSTEFHLYNEGKEIATDVSHKRVALSRDDAYQYSVFEYISAHKNEKLAPIPAMASLPSDFLTHLSPDEVQGTFFVKVGADGKARDVYKDEACKMKVENEYLTDALKLIWFTPAIDKGKPIEGVAQIHPNRIHYMMEPKI